MKLAAGNGNLMFILRIKNVFEGSEKVLDLDKNTYFVFCTNYFDLLPEFIL